LAVARAAKRLALYPALKLGCEHSDWRIEHHKTDEGDFMARIIVTTDPSERPDDPVLLDEFVCPDHLSDDHSAAQLMERLGWAVTDAENTQRAEQSP
jgi:hypothetical protein